MGSTLTFPGSTLFIILPRADSLTVSFTCNTEIVPGSSIPTLASYVVGIRTGELELDKRSSGGSLTLDRHLMTQLSTERKRILVPVGACLASALAYEPLRLAMKVILSILSGQIT